MVMDKAQLHQIFSDIKQQLAGDFYFGDDSLSKTVLMAYATDASVYQEHPTAVAIPKNKEDISLLIKMSQAHQIPLIPRTAGTSLAGQVVGTGLVVDTSRYLNKMLEVNTEEKWVRVQPGV